MLPLAAVVAVGPRRALTQHRLLAIVYAVGTVVVVVLAAFGQADRLLGDYGVTATQGSLLPAIALKSAAIHIDVLAVGLGVVPLLLGGGWAYSALLGGPVRLRAFAALTAFSLPRSPSRPAPTTSGSAAPTWSATATSSTSLPLLLLATAVCLFQERLPLLGIAAVTVAFAATAVFADFTPVAGLWVDSPESVLNGVIHDQSGGLPAGVFVALCGVVLGVICLALALIRRPVAVLVATVARVRVRRERDGYAFHRLLYEQHAARRPDHGQGPRSQLDRHGRAVR